jgi:hypothetical protein
MDQVTIFFGGNLESALKSTVKAPTLQTSRRHDHLSKELACRPHERFVCKESSIHNAKNLEQFRTHRETERIVRKRPRRLDDETSLD